MKNYTLGIFHTPEQAAAAVNRLHADLSIPSDNISYIYKDAHGTMKSSAEEAANSAPVEGAKTGATIGGVIGAGLGIATVMGLIPVIGPVLAAGPLIAALGFSGGVVATTAAGALTGAIAGGLVGALVNLGIGEKEAKIYEDKITGGNVLLAVHADEAVDVSKVLVEEGATDINSYKINM
jgi:hypothetical protein